MAVLMEDKPGLAENRSPGRAAGETEALLDRLCAPTCDARMLPSILIVVAHPDDETVGAGVRLRQWKQALIAHVTDGSPRDLIDAHNYGFPTREEYAAARRRELFTALHQLGIPPDQTIPPAFVDQEAALQLVPVAWWLVELFRDVQPEVVVTQPYEGGHPDHDATAFAVHAACGVLRRHGEWAPVILEMTSYHMGPDGISPCEFLRDGETPTRVFQLSESEKAFKRALFGCYATQAGTLQYFPPCREAFRVAPNYDFTAAPHPGQLFYESFSWGMNGERFRELAREALCELGIDDPARPESGREGQGI